ncbi:MAG: metalloregulator ArsR/SmtB family transcription factor [Gemmatimonadaceae bacterium]|nr:metalloregulator ArsR/SmtB family transcription factor [Gemmatimonadaceae bacterium]
MATATEGNTDRAAQWFHALSDPTRLGIVMRLTGGERCVCELTDALDAAQSRLSFHLRVLKDAGLISDRRDGRWVRYSLNREAIEEAGQFLASLKPRRRLKVECCG